jgi:hypothetical protein
VDLVRIDRFSPYHTRPEEFGISGLEPLPTYRSIFRELTPQAVRDIAYFFVERGKQGARFPDYLLPVEDALVRWHEIHETAWLFSVPHGKGLAVGDYRDPGHASVHLLDAREAAVPSSCNAARSRQALRAGDRDMRGSNERELDDVLTELAAAKLVISEGGLYLSLVIPHETIDEVPAAVGESFRESLRHSAASLHPPGLAL